MGSFPDYLNLDVVWSISILLLELVSSRPTSQIIPQIRNYLPILSVMVNIALNAFRHMISEFFRKLSSTTLAMGRSSYVA